jgi:hypothetical protein
MDPPNVFFFCFSSSETRLLLLSFENCSAFGLGPGTDGYPGPSRPGQSYGGDHSIGLAFGMVPLLDWGLSGIRPVPDETWHSVKLFVAKWKM